MRKGKLFLFILLPLLLLTGGITAYFLIMLQEEKTRNTHTIVAMKEQKSIIEDATTIKVFYPAGLSLQMSEVKIKRVFAPLKIAEASLKEFFGLKNIIDTGVIPEDTEILGLYYGINGILYIDLSKNFQRNFHGDIVDEYMLLKSLYETVMSNIEVDDVKVLIQGREIETLGGHFYIKYPLKQTVTQLMRIEEKPGDIR